MEQEELKRKLLGLWEKTTHSPKDILAILFEYYFDMRYVEYKEMDGKIVSALCGIPFSFGFGEKRLKGLYIISLSTEEGFRKKGILSELLSVFNNRMKEEFDFTFLNPQTELLADYYGTQGYHSSFYILEERFTPLHDFRNDYLLSLNDCDDRIKELKIGLLDEINVEEYDNTTGFTDHKVIDFIESMEKKGDGSVNLIHTPKDLTYIIEPFSVRHLNVFVSKDSDDKLTGVVFTQSEELKRIRVVATYVSDLCSYYSLLDFIKKKFPDHSISVNTSDPKYQIHSIIQQTYVSSNPAGGDLDNTFSVVEIPFNLNRLLHPLGMVRLLRFDKIIEFLASCRSDLDFKLHIRDYILPENASEAEIKNEDLKGKEISRNDKRKAVFVVKNGSCHIEYPENINRQSILNLTEKEVTELLLRKNDSSNLIMEAFGIPRLNLQIRLLPC